MANIRSESVLLRPGNCELKNDGKLNPGNRGGKELHRYKTGTLRVAPLLLEGAAILAHMALERGELFRVEDSSPYLIVEIGLADRTTR